MTAPRKTRAKKAAPAAPPATAPAPDERLESAGALDATQALLLEADQAVAEYLAMMLSNGVGLPWIVRLEELVTGEYADFGRLSPEDRRAYDALTAEMDAESLQESRDLLAAHRAGDTRRARAITAQHLARQRERNDQVDAFRLRALLPPEEASAMRERLGLVGVPSMSEWLAESGVPETMVTRASARILVDGRMILAAEAQGDGEPLGASPQMSAVVATMLPLMEPQAQKEYLADLERRLADAEQRAAAEAERRAEAERQRDAALASLTERRTGSLVQLGDRILIPGQLIDAGYKPGGGFRRQLAEVEQGDLFAPGDALDLLTTAAEALVEGTQLGDLSPAQVRALVAVFRVFSSEGDDGRELRSAPITVPARLMYQAAEIDPHNGRACRDLFQALDTLANRSLYVSLKFKDAAGRWCVAGDRSPIYHLRPYWTDVADGRKRREEDAEGIAQEWAGRSATAGAQPWKGPLPDAYEVALPTIMRKVWRTLVVRGDILRLLDTGAKRVRGERESFTGLEWRLFVEITQRTQSQQLSDDGTTLRSFVDRHELLADFYGAEEVKKARSKGKYKTGYVAQFEKAARALEEGKVARWVPAEAGRGSRRGEAKDVFELSPDIVHGTKERVEAEKRRRADRGALQGGAKAPRRKTGT